ncbi:MAG TPA: hypothetical protein VN229_23415, partial [Terriglobales bacterium]|nr:hypothetical protein [Terriglobales bacterium]
RDAKPGEPAFLSIKWVKEDLGRPQAELRPAPGGREGGIYGTVVDAQGDRSMAGRKHGFDL